MNPYEFGYAVGSMEKEAFTPAIAARLAQAGRAALTGAKTINTGAKHLVKGTGNVIGGFGHVADAAGAVGKGVGRGMMQLGQRTNAVADNLKGGVIKDLLKVLGHGTRGVGRITHGAGGGAGLVGTGLKSTGQGLKQVSQMGYGVPTAAALGLGAAGAAVAPTVPLPSVNFRSPLDVDFNYRTRNPIEVNW